MRELITGNGELLGLIVLLGTSLVANIFLHWVVVCGRLYRHGSRFPTGLLFWRVFRELRQYRDLTSAAARPLTWFYFGYILTWFNLLLLLALALRVLWNQTHPGNF